MACLDGDWRVALVRAYPGLFHHLAEARAACPCDVCGEAGQLYGNGWLTTRCMAHVEEPRLVEIRPGFEIPITEEWFARDWCVIRDTDSFIEVNSTSLLIEEASSFLGPFVLRSSRLYGWERRSQRA